MRTTINIDDELLERAKALAHVQRQSLGEVVSEGLRLVVFQHAKAKANETVQLVTFQGNGSCPGVDLDSNSALLDIMEGR